MVINEVVPRLPSRPRIKPLTTIVLHSTAGASAESSIRVLRQRGLSYHAIGDRDGAIFKCVNLGRVAFHAGESKGPNGPNVNEYALGYSFANLNTGHDPYTKPAIQACSEWIFAILDAYPSVEYITTHRLISWRRKTDPRGFDFLEFCKQFPTLKPWRQSSKHPWSLMD